MGRAYGNMGNAHSAMGYYEQAIKLHKQELTISKEVNDRSSEASTHGNLAVAYQVRPSANQQFSGIQNRFLFRRWACTKRR
jgi:tetratricopeptide (TPR) repeat protein